MKVLETHKKCILRQQGEGIYVREFRGDILLNSKSEFHQPALTRIVAVTGNLNDNQIYLNQAAQRSANNTRTISRRRRTTLRRREDRR